MSLRPLVMLALFSFLVACSSHAPKPAAPAPAPQQEKKIPGVEELGPLPAYQREVSGTLNGVPAGAEVELALLVIDDRSRPQQLLASSVLIGNNKPLAFRLRFNPEAFPAGARVELRGRASQSGQLILHLPAVRITQAITQSTGPLQFVKAP
ncbi:YbaY family lipoprotein [Pseudomonas fluorescens]|uniref:YbaY family lipoprotein n=1 Tax=Pseudomonas fluorescens TaxID=294 RepID=UPI001BEBF372|nr:YbaY family lipoprotein [Pseudomonas fluorescens]MBT2371277.1 YbaY family lipoprotein [Pseudomonas fluorescens]